VLEKCADMHGSSKSPLQSSCHKTMKSFSQFLDRKRLANNHTSYYSRPEITDFCGTKIAFTFLVSYLSAKSHLINICNFFCYKRLSTLISRYIGFRQVLISLYCTYVFRLGYIITLSSL